MSDFLAYWLVCRWRKHDIELRWILGDYEFRACRRCDYQIMRRWPLGWSSRMN